MLVMRVALPSFWSTPMGFVAAVLGSAMPREERLLRPHSTALPAARVTA
jgi:hypothetical protein